MGAHIFRSNAAQLQVSVGLGGAQDVLPFESLQQRSNHRRVAPRSDQHRLDHNDRQIRETPKLTTNKLTPMAQGAYGRPASHCRRLQQPIAMTNKSSTCNTSKTHLSLKLSQNKQNKTNIDAPRALAIVQRLSANAAITNESARGPESLKTTHQKQFFV
jgi:hypothetical protein